MKPEELKTNIGTGVYDWDLSHEVDLTHTQKRILFILRRKWRFGNGGSSWSSFEHLSKEINKPIKQTKEAVRDMAKKGIVKYSVLFDMEYKPHGSGYLLTSKWDVE